MQAWKDASVEGCKINMFIWVEKGMGKLSYGRMQDKQIPAHGLRKG